MELSELQKNADRFTGYADLYEKARPRCPGAVPEILTAYLGRRPDTVVDLGCGTGLSTLAWSGAARRAVGVEPSADMRKTAEKKARGVPNVEFRAAFAHATGLDARSADLVTCSQSFHWMEPVGTLAEVDRILKPGGIFATYDCDWPPVCSWKAEMAYEKLFGLVKRLERDLPDVRDSFVRWEKSGHLKRITDSGYFCYTREIVFSSTEDCTADRFLLLAESQGGLQKIRKTAPDAVEAEWEEFRKTVRSLFGEKRFKIRLCYRMRVGVKPEGA
jgi:ubiquinone/menaquinone biosynthesis C-methylase UbiE